MKTARTLKVLFALALLLPVLALVGANPARAQSDDPDHRRWAGAVYTQTNDPTGNKVIMYRRSHDGDLTEVGRYDTDGLGSGDALGSQGAVVLSDYGHLLFAVNAGSDEISVFAALPRRLVLLDTVNSGGDRPISVTVHHNLVYVLNAGDPNNITGFRLTWHGLEMIDGSTRSLSGPMTGPAQVEFSPNGRFLVVTEKMTNKIDTYIIGNNGLADGPTVQDSAGMTPFGFAFDRRGRLVVSEAFGGAPDASATSSYAYSEDGKLKVITGSAPTTETAACWVVITGNARYAYVTNTGSGTISGYSIDQNGALTLLDKDGVTASTGAGSMPIDEALSRGSRYLYALTPGTGSLHAFGVNQQDGSLTPVSNVTGVPAFAAGLAAR